MTTETRKKIDNYLDSSITEDHIYSITVDNFYNFIEQNFKSNTIEVEDLINFVETFDSEVFLSYLLDCDELYNELVKFYESTNEETITKLIKNNDTNSVEYTNFIKSMLYWLYKI